MPRTATPKQTKITVSKIQHMLSHRGWIAYNCELRKGRTCLASVSQEGCGGDERVHWNNVDHYLLLHHWILDTQKEFFRERDLDWLEYDSQQSWYTGDKAKKTQEIKEKYILWDKLAKEKPQRWPDAREIQQKLGFFDDMVGAWTTHYIEDKYQDKYYD